MKMNLLSNTFSILNNKAWQDWREFNFFQLGLKFNCVGDPKVKIIFKPDCRNCGWFKRMFPHTKLPFKWNMTCGINKKPSAEVGHCANGKYRKATWEIVEFYNKTSWNSQFSPPLVLSDLLLLGAGLSHCVPAQLAEHLKEVKVEYK